MGFFLSDAEVAAARKATSRRAKPIQGTLQATERGCEGCSLRQHWHRLSTPRMGLVGPPDADVLVLTEFPTQDEDVAGEPGKHPAYRLLRSVLPAGAFQRIAWAPAVRCSPVDKLPSAADRRACSLYVEGDVTARKFKGILALGSGAAASYVTGPMQHVRGLHMPVRHGTHVSWLMPTYSAIQIHTLGGNDRRNMAFPLFRTDVRRFFRELDRWGAPSIPALDPATVEIVTTYEQGRALLDATGPVIGIDLESHNFKPYLRGSKLLSAAVSDGTRTFAWSIDHSECHNEWGARLLLEAVRTRRWVAHNAGFELLWLLSLGYVPDETRIEDSQSVARLLFKRKWFTGLGDASTILLGTDVKALVPVSVEHLDSTPLDTVLRYNGLDALSCLLVWQRGRPLIQRVPYEATIGSMVATTYMERLGLDIDREVNARLDVHWSGEIARIADEAGRIYEAREYERTYQTAFNIGSAQALGQALVEFGKVPLPRTKTGFKTDEETLLHHAADNPLAKAGVDYREAVKNRSTYVVGWRELADATRDGKLHPSYTTLLTHTLRLSCTEPNIQNVPVRTATGRELRKQLGVPPGHVLIKLDQGQLEARTYCMHTRDPVLRKFILAGDDMHAEWRDRLLDKWPDYYALTKQRTGFEDEKKLMKAARDTIKSDFVFLTFFGGGAEQAATRLGAPKQIMIDLQADFWQKFSVAHAWVKKQRNTYWETAQVQTMGGLQRNDELIRGNETINTPVQGTAAFLVNEGMADLSRLARERNDFYLHPRLQIHDDLSFILPDDERLPGYINLIWPCMVALRHPWQIVPLVVEAAQGLTWDDTEFFALFKGEHA